MYIMGILDKFPPPPQGRSAGGLPPPPHSNKVGGFRACHPTLLVRLCRSGRALRLGLRVEVRVLGFRG